MTPKIHNKYEIMVTDTKTGNKKHYVTHNTVTENYKTRLIGSDVTNDINILYGEGSTPPTPQDTELDNYFGQSAFTFGVASIVYFFDDTTNTVTLSRTTQITTTQYVGKIFAEIGLGVSSTKIISRALFTDSEGQPMPIGPKTDTEIYDITVTVYMQLPVMDGFSYRKGHNYMTYALRLLRGELYFNELISNNLSLDLTLSSFGDKKILKSARLGQNTSNGVLGINAFPKIYEQNSGIVQKFPHSNFATAVFDNQQIGTGDGSNKRFGLATPFFDDGTLQVMVNGIIVPHTVINKCERYSLAFSGLTDLYGREVRWFETDSSYQNPVEFEWDTGIEYNTTLTYRKYYLLDLGAIVEINAFGMYTTSYLNTLSFSENGVDWFSVSSSQGSEVSDIFTLSEGINARYVRMYTTYGNQSELFGLIYSIHNIQLDTAPQLGDVVTASWQTSVPPKNENLEYEFTYTFDL